MSIPAESITNCDTNTGYFYKLTSSCRQMLVHITIHSDWLLLHPFTLPWQWMDPT